FDKEKATEYRIRRGSTTKKVCSMCGKYCAIRIANDYIRGER
ncbi:MAG: phosphomethylpyrimidine synthase ThiC, partial [Thermoplasmata archaeon]|nr:phosphomethylpyrimidine synthase ThiC [Thermoplasmata archaeon]